MEMTRTDHQALRETVHRVVESTPILDIHTHIYAPRFGNLLLWGIDELLTYHYLIAEVFRVAPMPYERFWTMRRQVRADYIWQHLFVERSPISEACRGILTALQALGLESRVNHLRGIRSWFAAQKTDEYVDKVLKVAGVRSVIMTNDPFDDEERPAWAQPADADPRFQAALRIDPLLNEWEAAYPRMKEWGYKITGDLRSTDLAEIRRFLGDWIAKIKPRYMAVSLPPTFAWPDDSAAGLLIRECVMPVARDAGVPFALMIGVTRKVNPELRLAADGLGRADIRAVQRLCMEFPDNRFLVTMLSRENQHELCVAARKMPNLHVFGCWWFLNNPSFIEEMTRQRLELLGLSFTPQHSDARVLDQLIYKWSHSRRIIGDVLADKYEDLAIAGWTATEDEIRRDVAGLFGGEFDRFCAGS